MGKNKHLLRIAFGTALICALGAAPPLPDDRVVRLEAEVARLRLELSSLRSVLADQGLIRGVEGDAPQKAATPNAIQPPAAPATPYSDAAPKHAGAAASGRPSIFDENYD